MQSTGSPETGASSVRIRSLSSVASAIASPAGSPSSLDARLEHGDRRRRIGRQPPAPGAGRDRRRRAELSRSPSPPRLGARRGVREARPRRRQPLRRPRAARAGRRGASTAGRARSGGPPRFLRSARLRAATAACASSCGLCGEHHIRHVQAEVGQRDGVALPRPRPVGRRADLGFEQRGERRVGGGDRRGRFTVRPSAGRPARWSARMRPGAGCGAAGAPGGRRGPRPLPSTPAPARARPETTSWTASATSRSP